MPHASSTPAAGSTVPERALVGPGSHREGYDPALRPDVGRTVIEVQNLSLWYGQKQALFGIDMQIPEKKITSLIGPSGCGKSTLLRCFNRMNDLIDSVRTEGDIRFQGSSIFAPDVEINALRKRIGMVFQKSNPFPKSIFENIAYGPRIHGIKNRTDLEQIVEESLKSAALWNEVKDRLHESALGMSGGQQQRLCIARAIAVQPEVILLDEPCSALDPISTGRIEDLMHELKERYSLLIVTHNMQQASRCSDFTSFFYLGKMVEFAPTERLFTTPAKQETEDYISGRFG